MGEKIIKMEGVHPPDIFGLREEKLQLLKNIFPKLKIISRGEEVIVIGDDRETSFFEAKFSIMLAHFERFSKISEENILEIMAHDNGYADMPADDDNSGELLLYGRNGVAIRARSPNQRRMVSSFKKHDMLFAIGPAGTGKTYTAVALAVKALKNKEVKRIILARPAVDAGENLGFLPGDLKDKLDPYLRPLYDALRDMIPPARLATYLEDGTIEIAPLAFMRGRTLDNAFAILDEAQNATESQLKMFLTRMGKSARFIITGDITQIDLPRHQVSGLLRAVKILNHIRGIDFIFLNEKDVIRHDLVTKIIEAYENKTSEHPINKNNKNPETMQSITETKFAFPKQTGFYKGKIRDVYTIGNDTMLMIVTDRISAFDVVLPRGIPYKGQVLNQIAAKFLDATTDIVPNWKTGTPDPMVTAGILCEPLKVEMVIRGYLCGHAWREYKKGKRSLCGVPMPEGMKENEAFPEPIITPTTKAAVGHDEDISAEEIIKQGLVSEPDYKLIENYTRQLFQRGSEMAREMGLILVDTKYEFGKANGRIYLIDEIHTPDSSRYFYLDGYDERLKEGQPQKQLSKEFVREWLMEQGFNGQNGQAVPDMPDEFVAQVSDRYIELYEQITGEKFIKTPSGDIHQRIMDNCMQFLEKKQ